MQESKQEVPKVVSFVKPGGKSTEYLHSTLSTKFQGGDSNCLPPFWKKVYYKRKESAPPVNKFLPFTTDPLQKGLKAW